MTVDTVERVREFECDYCGLAYSLWVQGYGSCSALAAGPRQKHRFGAPVAKREREWPVSELKLKSEEASYVG